MIRMTIGHSLTVANDNRVNLLCQNCDRKRMGGFLVSGQGAIRPGQPDSDEHRTYGMLLVGGRIDCLAQRIAIDPLARPGLLVTEHHLVTDLHG